VTKHTEEVSLDLVNLACIVRHKRESISVSSNLGRFVHNAWRLAPTCA
jgi:hypothetical protein